MKRLIIVTLSLLVLSPFALSQQQDATGTADHPLFTRMPGYWIHNCDVKEFNVYQFPVAKGATKDVEGKYTKITYYPQATQKIRASEIQILRNFENAVQKYGGKVVYKDRSRETMTLSVSGKEYWVDLWAEFTGKYGFTLIEKGEMTQDVVANANAMANDLRMLGHAAVNGIYFDTGKSDLKPESKAALDEIAKLLQQNAGLTLFVVGHTDNTGAVESNVALSEQRTASVVRALVRERGIEASRLKGFGNGPYAPVATNDTEEGRAKNRRVELVKQQH